VSVHHLTRCLWACGRARESGRRCGIIIRGVLSDFGRPHTVHRVAESNGRVTSSSSSLLVYEHTDQADEISQKLIPLPVSFEMLPPREGKERQRLSAKLTFGHDVNRRSAR
jgi:hypothetical protein